MEEKSKLAYVVSLHLAIFSTGAAAYGNGTGMAFVFGGISFVVFSLTTIYEAMFVAPRRKYQQQTPNAD